MYLYFQMNMQNRHVSLHYNGGTLLMIFYDVNSILKLILTTFLYCWVVQSVVESNWVNIFSSVNKPNSCTLLEYFHYTTTPLNLREILHFLLHYIYLTAVVTSYFIFYIQDQKHMISSQNRMHCYSFNFPNIIYSSYN